MPELLGLGLPFVPVDPVPRHGRAVEGFEGKAEGAAAENRLLHVSDLLRAVKLIKFFKVHHAEIAERYRNGFQLAGVIQTVKLDRLPGGDIGQGVRLFGLFPQVPDPHAINDAVILRPDAGGNSVADFTQHYRVDVRGAHDQQHHLRSSKGRLQAAAPAIAQILVILAGPDRCMGGVILRDDQIT